MGSVVGSLGSAVGGGFGDFLSDPLGHKAIDNGVAAQQGATDQANGVLGQQYNQQRQDLAPWQQAGTTALSQMANPDFQRDFSASDFQKDPGYDFRMQEGQKALERSAAANGGLQTGGTLKELTQYGQNFASNEYNNAYNRFNNDRNQRYGRLSQLAGYGQNAVNGLVGASNAYGTNMSNNYTGMGNAVAAGNIAKANSNQQLLSGLISGGAKAAGNGAGGK